jgi:hypothetical protein
MRIPFALLTLVLAPSIFAGGIDLATGHDVAFFSKLRFDYAERKDFSPDWTIQDERKAIEIAYHDGDTKKTIKLGRMWLEKVPVDSEVYLMLAMCLKEEGDLKGYCQFLSPFYGLLQSITATGDGKTADTAFKVISVAEEYALLREIGAKVKSQSLAGQCDKMQVERNGKEYTFYFDIRIPLRADLKALEAK